MCVPNPRPRRQHTLPDSDVTAHAYAMTAQCHSTKARDVVAFVYDRHTAPDGEALRCRLETCSAFARAQGWEIGGWHVDKGLDALSADHRPALEVALRLMDRLERGQSCVLLIYSHDRLHNDRSALAKLTARVDLAGGRVVSIAAPGAVNIGGTVVSALAPGQRT